MADELRTVDLCGPVCWAKWLQKHHANTAGVWLRLAKRGATANPPPMTYAQALDEALCYGWIDGQKKAESADTWLQRFSPRASRSIWSQVNQQKVKVLTDAGRMQPAGLAEVVRARADGRWAVAYPPQSLAQVPADLQLALDANPDANAFFATLDSRNRYALLFRIHGAKKAETRVVRIAKFVAMLALGKKIYE